MHSQDMQILGLSQGDMTDVSTPHARIRLSVRPNDDLMRGTVAIPHGWGHHTSHMQIARETKGVNVNILAHDGLESIESVSGMSQLTGLTVQIVKSTEPLAPTWSGLADDFLELGQFKV